MYDVNDYGRMMADPVRMRAFTEALRRAVKPGCVVVDVGTGTGFFALLAAKLGARKVYAIDTNPCIHLAREVAKRNGFGDVIEFIHENVFEVELPEKADVLVSDCRGAFALSGRNPELVFRARDRFLADGGTVVSLRDELHVSVIEWPEVHDELVSFWSEGGFDWSPCRAEGLSSVVTSPERTLAGARTLVPPTPWAEIDYLRGTKLDFHGTVRREAAAGTAQFLVLSFKAFAAEGLEFGTLPELIGKHVYSPVLLPLATPLSLEEGETVEIHLDARAAADDYLFAWAVRARAGVRKQMSGGNALRASTLNSQAEWSTLASTQSPR